MCGISGIVDLRELGVSLKKLQAMNEIVVHRGPDDEGIALFTETGDVEISCRVTQLENGKKYCVGLAHRRLSILDLSQKAHQPMLDRKNRYCIVYNGEIYNHEELRTELKSLGYQFVSNSDTEVVLAAYIMWGIECQTKFNGMWAFAIYDSQNQTLFCSRDRFGIKPFYYFLARDCFVFGSEIKQILEYCRNEVRIAEKILADFIFWGYESHTEKTFFENVVSLPQSHYLLLDKSDIRKNLITPKKYWQYEPNASLSSELAITHFRELFTDAVKIRLRSDVPVGTTLSGGLDSSSVACVMAELLDVSNGNHTTKMFTSVYPDPGLSEKVYADAVVRKTGFQQFCVYPNSADLKSDWDRFIWHMEEPFASLSYFSNWKVYKKAKEQNTPVILNGQGGDELLLGYERYRVAYLNMLLRKGNIKKVLSEMLKIKHNANMPFLKQLAYQFYFGVPAIRIRRRLHLLKRYLKEDFYYSYKKNTGIVKDEFNNKSLIEMQQKEFFKFQLQHLLRHEDRVSMAFSVEARLPFLDYRLFNFILSQEDSLKLNSGWSKYVLRRAMDGYIPDSIKNRTDKMGFDTPIKRLFGENRELYLDILSRHRNDEFIDVKNTIEGFSNNSIHPNLLCSIFTFLSWREVFEL